MWLNEEAHIPICTVEVVVSCRFLDIAYWIYKHFASMNVAMKLDMCGYDGDFAFVK